MTLNLLSSSCFSSRRSHLDSASYRTLVRIFSLCSEESLYPSNPNHNQNANSAVEDFVQHSSTEKDSVPRESGDVPNPNFQLAEESGNVKRRNEEGQIEEGTAFTDYKSEIYNAVKEFEFDDDEFVDLELLEGVMNDCAKLFDVPEQDDFDTSGDKNLETKNQEDNGSEKGINFGFKKLETKEAQQEKDVGAQQDKDVSSHELEDPGECVNGERGGRMMEIEEGTPQEACANSDNSIDGKDFEEGEIPNDFEKPNESVDLMHEAALHVEKKLEEGSVCVGFDKNQNLNYTTTFSRVKLIEGHHNQGLNSFGDNKCLGPEHKKNYGYSDDDVKHRAGGPHTLVLTTNKDREMRSEAEILEVKVKKKRRVLTEERKAKKKRAKRRNRAQKEREQGVKRLKLQPIVKPKEVKYCNFFLAGRCQQGEACKFSHDTTPLTKSQPCKYLATDSCLKGDDCPFDHELSKYPCHNYMSIGTCIRGDKCKFSHKMLITEGPSPVSVAGKTADPSSLLNKPKSSTAWSSQLIMKKPSANNAKLSTPISPRMIMKKPPAENLVTNSKLSTPLPPPPPGIRFLSFGKGTSEFGGNKQKSNQQQQKREKLLAAAQNILSAQHNSFPAKAQCDEKANTNACKKKSDDGSLKTKVSEASKLLEEFLFFS